MGSPLIFVRDGRTLPFIPVTTAALAAIREACDQSRQVPFARSLYLALLEAANAERDARTAISRRRLGELAGMGNDAVTTYGRVLVAAGVLRIQERQFDGQRLENEYVLIEPDEGIESEGGRSERLGVGAQDGRGSRSERLPVSVEKELLEETPRRDARRLATYLARRVQANGFTVPADVENPPPAWVDPFRLMLTRDRKQPEDEPWTVDDVRALIDWATTDDFWQGNIRSSGKLRKHRDTLRVRLRQQLERPRNGNGNGRTGWTAEDARRCAREMEGVIEGTAHDVV